MDLLEALGGIGYALDTPGAYFRGLLAGRPGERVSGEELTGGAGSGLAVEMIADPLNLVPITPFLKAIGLTAGLGAGALGLSKAINRTGQVSRRARRARRGMLDLVGEPEVIEQAADPFYSRLERAITEGPEQFVTRDEVRRVTPGRTITHPQTGEVIKEIPEKVHVQEGQSAYDQMMGYLEGRAHPQEIDWVLGGLPLEGSQKISKPLLLGALEKGGIDLDVVRRGGKELSSETPDLNWLRHVNRRAGYVYMHKGVQPPMGAVMYAREGGSTSGKIIGYNAWGPKTDRGFPGTKLGQFKTLKEARAAVERHVSGHPEYLESLNLKSQLEHGPLKFPNMLIPGGMNTMEVPIRLGGRLASVSKDVLTDFKTAGKKAKAILEQEQNLGFDSVREALAAVVQHDDFATRWDIRGLEKIHDLENFRDLYRKAKGHVRDPIFPDVLGHFGDDVLAWTIHDQRKMPDGKTATFLQELQSDWHQKGRARGYMPRNIDKKVLDLRMNDALRESELALNEVNGLYIQTREAIAAAPQGSTAEWSARNVHGQIATVLGSLRPTFGNHDTVDLIIEGFTKQSQYVQDMLAPFFNRWLQAEMDIANLSRLKTGSIPDAPFKGNEWMKLGLRQTLADAIQRGDDYLILPPPAGVSKAQGLPLAKAKELYGEIAPNLVNEMMEPYGVKMTKKPLPGAASSRVVFYNRLIGIGPGEYPIKTIEVDGRGVGTITAFGPRGQKYKVKMDGVEPRSFRTLKEAKKYAKQEARKKASDQMVPAVEIPEKMKENFRKHGFPMMSVGGVIGGSLIGALGLQQMQGDRAA